MEVPLLQPTFTLSSGIEIAVKGRWLRTAQLEADGFEFLEQGPEPVLDALRESGRRIDLFTFMQRLPDTSPRYAYSMEWDNFAALEITTFEHWWNHQIGFKARNKAKQAESKGVVIQEVPFGDDLVRGIWNIYNECPVRQGRRYWHYGKDFATVYREEATHLDHSAFTGAYFQGKLIGFIKLVWDQTNTQAYLMNIISMLMHRDKAPTNALFAAAVKCCAERNIRYLVYARFVYAGKERSGLSDFKERNGMRRIDVPRYYIPLTFTGRVALRLGLHKPLKDRLPETLLSRLRDLRALWYKRKLRSAGNAC